MVGQGIGDGRVCFHCHKLHDIEACPIINRVNNMHEAMRGQIEQAERRWVSEADIKDAHVLATKMQEETRPGNLTLAGWARERVLRAKRKAMQDSEAAFKAYVERSCGQYDRRMMMLRVRRFDRPYDLGDRTHVSEYQRAFKASAQKVFETRDVTARF